MRNSRILAGANLAALMGMFGTSQLIPRPIRKLKRVKQRSTIHSNVGREGKQYLLKGIRS